MANALTNYGQEVHLFDDQNRPSGTVLNIGGLANQGKKLKLMRDTSVPNKDGSGFVEVANGNGYVTGGHAITSANFTLSLDGGNIKAALNTETWTAAGGTIPDIDGVFMTDADDNVLVWWERATTTTLADGDDLVASGLYIKLG